MKVRSRESLAHAKSHAHCDDQDHSVTVPTGGANCFLLSTLKTSTLNVRFTNLKTYFWARYSSGRSRFSWGYSRRHCHPTNGSRNPSTSLETLACFSSFGLPNLPIIIVISCPTSFTTRRTLIYTPTLQ